MALLHWATDDDEQGDHFPPLLKHDLCWWLLWGSCGAPLVKPDQQLRLETLSAAWPLVHKLCTKTHIHWPIIHFAQVVVSIAFLQSLPPLARVTPGFTVGALTSLSLAPTFPPPNHLDNPPLSLLPFLLGNQSVNLPNIRAPNPHPFH
jgi:hypothetical protein